MRDRLVGTLVACIGDAHEALGQGAVRRVDAPAAVPDRLDVSGRQAYADELRCRKVHPPTLEVLPHIAEDVRELHGLTERRRSLQHPGVAHAMQLREPPT